MSSLRALSLRHPQVAALVLALALLMRIMVPGGFMPTAQAGTLVIELCNATGPATMTIDVPGMKHDPAQAQPSCAFADLSLVSLAAADPVAAIALPGFALAAGSIVARTRAPAVRAWLRPPLRGPPPHP